MTIVHTITRDLDLPDQEPDRGFMTTMENLSWLHDRWTDLRASIERGTPRPWREPTLTPEQQAKLDAEARAEKLERGAFTLGESPAPIHLDTLDKTIELTTTMARLARTIATELGHKGMLVRAAMHHYDDPILLITYVRNHFDQVTLETISTVQEAAARLRAGITHHFSEVGSGQLLKADCPYCGHRQLHVRTIGGRRNPEPVIRCESGTCNPAPAVCGAWHKEMPIWPMHEWEWLAGEIARYEANRH